MILALAVGMAGCGEMNEVGPPAYTHSPTLTSDLKDRPKLQKKVVELMEGLFGPNPAEVHLPMESGLPEDGARLASKVVLVDPLGEVPEAKEGAPRPPAFPSPRNSPNPSPPEKGPATTSTENTACTATEPPEMAKAPPRPFSGPCPATTARESSSSPPPPEPAPIASPPATTFGEP